MHVWFRTVCPDVTRLPPRLWQHFDTNTQDLAGIEWAPNGCVLAAWDTCLEVQSAAPVSWCSECHTHSPRSLHSTSPSTSLVSCHLRSS